MRWLTIVLVLGLTACSNVNIEHMTVLTSVGPGCKATRGLQRAQDATGEAGANVLAQAGSGNATLDLATLLSSAVECQ